MTSGVNKSSLIAVIMLPPPAPKGAYRQCTRSCATAPLECTPWSCVYPREPPSTSPHERWRGGEPCDRPVAGQLPLLRLSGPTSVASPCNVVYSPLSFVFLTALPYSPCKNSHG